MCMCVHVGLLATSSHLMLTRPHHAHAHTPTYTHSENRGGNHTDTHAHTHPNTHTHTRAHTENCGSNNSDTAPQPGQPNPRICSTSFLRQIQSVQFFLSMLAFLCPFLYLSLTLSLSLFLSLYFSISAYTYTTHTHKHTQPSYSPCWQTHPPKAHWCSATPWPAPAPRSTFCARAAYNPTHFTGICPGR